MRIIRLHYAIMKKVNFEVFVFRYQFVTFSEKVEIFIGIQVVIGIPTLQKLLFATANNPRCLGFIIVVRYYSDYNIINRLYYMILNGK
jgi:hypothetical protein